MVYYDLPTTWSEDVDDQIVTYIHKLRK
jgi:hypothetical protein